MQGENLTSNGAYTGDIYFKGAWVLHTLRWVLGDEDFFGAIWRFANDDEYAYGLVSSEDFAALVGEVSGKELDWFWDRYLYRAEEPRWHLTRSPEGDRERVEITWDDSDFKLPLPIAVAGEPQRLEMPNGRASFLVERGTTVEVDPLGQVLASSSER